MQLFNLRPSAAETITNFDSSGVSSVEVATGSGGGHVYTLYFSAKGQIGRHPAGPAQIFLAVEGAGWVEGGDGIRRAIKTGEAAYIEPGEMHAKGSESGMTAIMIQMDQIEPVANGLAAND